MTRKVTRTHFGATIDKELVLDLRDISAQTKVPMSKLMDEAIELLKEHRDYIPSEDRLTFNADAV